MATCPIYNSSVACDQHPDCLFLRNAGCAVTVGMNIAARNEKKLDAIYNIVSNIETYLARIDQRLK